MTCRSWQNPMRPLGFPYESSDLPCTSAWGDRDVEGGCSTSSMSHALRLVSLYALTLSWASTHHVFLHTTRFYTPRVSTHHVSLHNACLYTPRASTHHVPLPITCLYPSRASTHHVPLHITCLYPSRASTHHVPLHITCLYT